MKFEVLGWFEIECDQTAIEDTESQDHRVTGDSQDAVADSSAMGYSTLEPLHLEKYSTEE